MIKKGIAVMAMCTISLYSVPITNELVSASSSTLLISEIFYDPIGTDTGLEWIELRNVSSEPIDLANWTIQVAGTTFVTKTALSSYIVNPGMYVLIGEAIVSESDITVPSLAMQNGGSEADGVRILDSSGTIVDTVLYDTPNTNSLPDDSMNSSTDTAPDVASGYSLARIGTSDTDSSSTDFVEVSSPTPGEPNLFPPVATITIPSPLFLGQQVTFDGSDSFDPDLGNLSYQWSITKENCTVTFGTTELLQYTFQETGSYQLSLTITDSDSLSSSTQQQITVTEDPENPVITTIASARTMPTGTTVTISGTITAPPGILYENDGYIQDGTAGIRFKIPSDMTTSYGATYRLSGILSTVYGEVRLNVSSVKELSPDPPRLAIQSSQEALHSYIGSLVSTTLTIKEKNGKTLVAYQENPDSLTSVFISDLTGIEISNFKNKSTLTITGVVSQYGTNEDGSPRIRVMPRFETDIMVIDSSRLASTGSPALWFLWVISLLVIVFFKCNIITKRPIYRQ